MITIKDTERSQVQRSFDGRVHKEYRGLYARQRMENEIRVLQYLERAMCPFVPRLISVDRALSTIVQTSCGYAAPHVSPSKLEELFRQLRSFGVEHDDAELRNVTYRPSDGRFCIVDFELARIIDPMESRIDAHLDLFASLE